MQCLLLDLTSLPSVRSFVEAVQGLHRRIDYLILNAGIAYTPWQLTEDGFELQASVGADKAALPSAVYLAVLSLRFGPY